MDIALNSNLSQASLTRITQSTDALKTQPTTKATELNKGATTPAAVYHPSEAASALTPTLVATENWVGRSQSVDFPQAALQHKSATESLKTSFDEFKAGLAYAFPDLADKKFGFSVEADGSLKATNKAGELSAADVEQLDTLLNASSSLKQAAVNYRDASIELVETDSPWGGSYLGGYNLNKDNFSRTIDLAALFIEKTSKPDPEQIAGTFSHQLWSKGEVATKESEAAMLAERAARKAAVNA